MLRESDRLAAGAVALRFCNAGHVQSVIPIRPCAFFHTELTYACVRILSSRGRGDRWGQFALSTSSTKLSALVATHSVDTASTPIVPVRSPAGATRPLAGDSFTSRCTTMPRRGSYLNIRADASTDSGLLAAARLRGVKDSATLG